MKARRLVLFLFATLSATVALAQPFAILRSAYASKDAAKAAAAYTPDAEVIYRYEGVPEEIHRGTEAIDLSFRSFFTQFEATQPLDLNFRITGRMGSEVTGVYRLKVGRAFASFGRFSAIIGPDGALTRDQSTHATMDDFEEARGPVLLAADEEILDRNYYGHLTGRYLLPDGCQLVVTRSIVRLFVRNSCTNEWRGLSRLSGRVWTSGDQMLSDKVVATFRFAAFDSGNSPSVAMEFGGSIQTATRQTVYKTEHVSFESADGTQLKGTIYLPIDTKVKLPASVMIHGSGPQDRDGYASIIAVLADQLASSGRAVLAYDKRGSGGSGGDGNRATFEILADDAKAAMDVLKQRPEIDGNRIGLAGSSQAGWVAAKAIERGAKPADVLLLGAAGAAIPVAKQNLYNTWVTMRCNGIAERDIRLALDQQTAFFAYLKDANTAPRLDELTKQGRARPVLVDWLFPDSVGTDRTADAWYVVLDPSFDPLPVWKDYKGRALFLFAEYDDATPTALAAKLLRKTSANVQILKGAQHLGLNAADVCKAGLDDATAFSPVLMRQISDFAAG